MASETSGGLLKRSISFEPEQLRWLQERGRRMERSVDWQIRDLIRAAMDAEYVARRDDVDVEQ